MKEQLNMILNSKNLVINEYLIKVAVRKELSLNEFLVLVYLDNYNDKKFDVELMSSTLGIDVNKTMEAFNSLMIKGLVSLESVKDELSMFNEVINLDEYYKLVYDLLNSLEKKEVKDDVFKRFEQELGRTMSPMELEMINGWLSDGISEEIVLGALKEAVINGVTNFRYIDKIIYEWNKKGFKTLEDVNNYMKKRNSEPKSKKVAKKEQEISDFNWLDE